MGPLFSSAMLLAFIYAITKLGSDYENKFTPGEKVGRGGMITKLSFFCDNYSALLIII